MVDRTRLLILSEETVKPISGMTSVPKKGKFDMSKPVALDTSDANRNFDISTASATTEPDLDDMDSS